jgi:BirA family biotin operon repressor/biotin-[acetyl-CoA-carboxylase] ligase
MTSTIGQKIHRFSSLDSTNNYAIQLVGKNDTLEGEVVWALEQTLGRGQLGNIWESARGKNLTCSVILHPFFLKAEKQFYLSKIVSLAIHDVLVTEIKKVQIKWPNDLYLERKKIAGILIENTIQGEEVVSSVAGIGINLNQKKFISGAPNPVSLTQLTGKKYDIEEILSRICGALDTRYEQLKAGQYSMIDNDYLRNLFQFNQFAHYIAGNIRFEAKIRNVEANGLIEMESSTGETYVFGFQEFDYLI